MVVVGTLSKQVAVLNDRYSALQESFQDLSGLFRQLEQRLEHFEKKPWKLPTLDSDFLEGLEGLGSRMYTDLNTDRIISKGKDGGTHFYGALMFCSVVSGKDELFIGLAGFKYGMVYDCDAGPELTRQWTDECTVWSTSGEGSGVGQDYRSFRGRRSSETKAFVECIGGERARLSEAVGYDVSVLLIPSVENWDNDLQKHPLVKFVITVLKVKTPGSRVTKNNMAWAMHCLQLAEEVRFIFCSCFLQVCSHQTRCLAIH